MIGSNDIQTAKNIYSFMMKYPEYLLHVKKGFFRFDDLQNIAMTAKKFYKKYKEAPSYAQMKLLLKDDDNISPEVIDDYYNNNIDSIDKDWLKQTVEGWIQLQTLIYHVAEVGTLIKTSNASYENAGDLVKKSMDRLDNVKTVTFDDDLGMNFFDTDNHKSTKEDKVPWTWDYWNKSSSGGLDNKTLNLYFGFTNVGKTILLCNDAAEFVRKGKNVLFITCEMAERKVARRISGNLFNITLEEYDQLVESPEKLKKRMNKLVGESMLPLGQLWIKEYPTGQCTTLDLEAYVKKIQEELKFKVDIILIDYINIMSNYRNPNSENTYLKIKSIAEDLRAIAVKYNLIIITASQLGRNANDASDINISDVSESMGLAHTADSIIGIIQTEDMQIGEIDEETGQAVPYYWFKILKIREGVNKNKKFRVNINYSKMKLIEKSEVIDTMSHFK